MISTLNKQGTGGFAYSALRTFDAWGVIRRGAQTGDPKGRYCANLGHKQDDESGLVYMRARYYEPGSGRFISEDPEMQGRNGFLYARDNPVSFVDSSGCDPLSLFFDIIALSWFVVTTSIESVAAVVGLKRILSTVCGRVVLVAGMAMVVADFGQTFGPGKAGDKDLAFLFASCLFLAPLIIGILCNSAVVPPNQIGQEAVGALAAYSIVLSVELALTTIAGDASE
jgi:RHS repeat-associated protein